VPGKSPHNNLYYTKEELKGPEANQLGFDTRFIDGPAREMEAGIIKTWTAELTLVGRNKSGIYQEMINLNGDLQGQ
jgi:hypothetical protein